MSFEKARFYEYLVRDEHLIRMLKKHGDDLKYAAGRTDKHEELRETLTQTLTMKVKKLEQAQNQMQMLAALEQERTLLNLQTRFLLMADYIDEMHVVDEVFFPEEV